MPRGLLAACALVSLGAPIERAQAAGEFALTEDDFFAPFPTVLSASRLVQPLPDAPTAMTVIDREMIEASSARRVVDLLQLVPGFQVAYKEGIDAISTYHGFSNDFPLRSQVLVDGRSVYDPGLNGVLWSALPLTLEQIERIEVVRGPNAAAYGSNAFLGTINIVTRSAETAEPLRARALYGGSDAAEVELGHAGRIGDVAYRINAAQFHDDGFDDKADDSRSRILNLQATYRPTLSDAVTVRAGWRETDFDSEAFRYPRERLFRSHFQQIGWERSFGADEGLALTFYHNAFESPDSLQVPGAFFIDYTLATHRYDLELEHHVRPAPDWRLSWGAGLRHDAVEGGVFDTGDTLTRDQLRLFGNAEWQAASDVLINLGLMAEEFSDLGGYLSPRVSANWRVAPRHTLRASVARAYRMPTFVERRGEVTIDLPGPVDVIQLKGSTAVDPERIHSIDLGWLIELPAYDGSLDFRLFHHEIEPIIDNVRIDGSPLLRLRTDEVGTLRVDGFEAQARLRPARGSRVHLAYAYAVADGARLEDVDLAGNPLPVVNNPEPNDDKVPRHTLTALVAQDLGAGWRLSGTYSYVSDMTWMGEGSEVDGRGRLDAKLRRRLRAGGGDIEFSLNVHNLLDETYYDFASPEPIVPLAGNASERRIYAQIAFFQR